MPNCAGIRSVYLLTVFESVFRKYLNPFTGSRIRTVGCSSKYAPNTVPGLEIPSRRKRPWASRYILLLELREIRLPSASTCRLSLMASAEKGAPITIFSELAMISVTAFGLEACAMAVSAAAAISDNANKNLIFLTPSIALQLL